MYHISDIKKMERCPRLYWLSRREKKEFIPFVNYNMNMMELVKERLYIHDYFEGKANDDGELALAAFHEGKALINARFAYEEMRIKVPVLLQKDNQTIIYFTYKSCYPKEGEAQYMADTLSILELLGIHVDKVFAIHLNSQYILEDKLDVTNLLLVNEYLYNSKNHPQKKIKDLIAKKKRDILVLLQQLREIEAQEEIQAERTTQCTRGNKCMFYDDCFPEKTSSDAITNLVQSAHKYAMLEDGIEKLADVDVNRIEGTRHQYAQIMASRKNGLYIDKTALRCWNASHIHYPISYLDFEWETFAFPPYKGMRPFDVLTFQYSLHIEEKGKDLQHVGFIGEGDCRIAFIEDLLKNIPKKGTILVYNMEGAEKLRLVQLANQYPQYKKELKEIWERMVDLSLPFSTGTVYDVRMAGFFSLKTLVPIFSNYDYKDLAISYGMDAVENWRLYGTLLGEEKQRIYDQLTQYCSMDTYAEYIVYHALEKEMKE